MSDVEQGGCCDRRALDQNIVFMSLVQQLLIAQ
jgi:hypothetical protein